MCWRNASDVTNYPNRERDELLVQGYEKRGNKCPLQQSEDAQQPGRKHQSTRHHEKERINRLPVVDCKVTRIEDNHQQTLYLLGQDKYRGLRSVARHMTAAAHALALTPLLDALSHRSECSQMGIDAIHIASCYRNV